MSGEQVIGHISWSPDFRSEDRKLPAEPVDEDIIDLINRGAIKIDIGVAPVTPTDEITVQFAPATEDDAKVAAALRPHQEKDENLHLIGPCSDDYEVEFTYTNWKGKTAIRRAIFTSLYWGSNEYHTEPQFLVHGYDLDKKAPRTYALRDISNLKNVNPY